MSESEKDILLSRDDVQEAIHNAIGSGARLIDYKLSSMSGDKVGFAGAHQFLHVEVMTKDDGEKSTRRFFVKTLPYDIPKQVDMIRNCKLFVKEAKFYEIVLPKLMECVHDKYWSARCYLAKENVLILDNLRDKNFELKGMSLTEPRMRSAMTTLALVHASAMCAEKKLGRTFLEAYPEVFVEAVWTSRTKFYDWYRHGVEAAVAVAKKYGLDHARIVEVCGAVFEKAAPSSKWPNVVCHGDTWAYNCLFNDSGKCALVDFQMVRYAPATSDVATLLFLATRKNERRQTEREMLRHYHEELCRCLAENDASIEPPRLERVMEEYEDMKLIGMVHAVVDRPITQLLDFEDTEGIDTSDGCMNIVFGKRDELVTRLMDKHPDYRDMVLELVGEIIECAK